MRFSEREAVCSNTSIHCAGKLRIYEHFLKQESADENVGFLKNEYGIGGYSVHASRELDIWADGKGIKITAEPGIGTVLTWTKAAKRIGELIAADRYLSPAEKEQYSAYREQRALIAARTKISEEFRSIINDYKDYVTQLGQPDKTVDRWYLVSCADAFNAGKKKMHARTSEGVHLFLARIKGIRTGHQIPPVHRFVWLSKLGHIVLIIIDDGAKFLTDSGAGCDKCPLLPVGGVLLLFRR